MTLHLCIFVLDATPTHLGLRFGLGQWSLCGLTSLLMWWLGYRSYRTPSLRVIHRLDILYAGVYGMQSTKHKCLLVNVITVEYVALCL